MNDVEANVALRHEPLHLLHKGLIGVPFFNEARLHKTAISLHRVFEKHVSTDSGTHC